MEVGRNDDVGQTFVPFPTQFDMAYRYYNRAFSLIVAIHRHILFSNIITSILWTKVLLLLSLQCRLRRFPLLPFATSLFTSILCCCIFRRHRHWFDLVFLLPPETLKTNMFILITVVVFLIWGGVGASRDVGIGDPPPPTSLLSSSFLYSCSPHRLKYQTLLLACLPLPWCNLFHACAFCLVHSFPSRDSISEWAFSSRWLRDIPWWARCPPWLSVLAIWAHVCTSWYIFYVPPKTPETKVRLCMEEHLTILKSSWQTRHGYEQEFVYIQGLPAQNNFPSVLPTARWGKTLNIVISSMFYTCDVDRT